MSSDLQKSFNNIFSQIFSDQILIEGIRKDFQDLHTKNALIRSTINNYISKSPIELSNPQQQMSSSDIPSTSLWTRIFKLEKDLAPFTINSLNPYDKSKESLEETLKQQQIEMKQLSEQRLLLLQKIEQKEKPVSQGSTQNLKGGDSEEDNDDKEEKAFANNENELTIQQENQLKFIQIQMLVHQAASDKIIQNLQDQIDEVEDQISYFEGIILEKEQNKKINQEQSSALIVGITEHASQEISPRSPTKEIEPTDTQPLQIPSEVTSDVVENNEIVQNNNNDESLPEEQQLMPIENKNIEEEVEEEQEDDVLQNQNEDETHLNGDNHNQI